MKKQDGSRALSDREPISELTTNRLSIYLQCLNDLESQAVKTVSSHELARRFHLNSAQIRKDLAYFGELGIRGVGYNVATLREHLVHTIGIDKTRNAVIVGAGNLGMALADYKGFNAEGFHIVALFDIDPAKVATQSRSGIPVLPLERLTELVASNKVEIGIIAVPGEMAQNVYDALVDAGIRAVLNFAPVQIRRSSGVKIKSVDLRINLESLSYYLKNLEEGNYPEENSTE